MQNRKPLEYESSKVILQYLDANSRILLAAMCPSIRKTEKLIPFRISELSFTSPDSHSEAADSHSTLITINSTEYQFGTYRHYPKGQKTPQIHREENERGGAPTDLDRFGYEDFDSDREILPGDVEVGTESMRISRGINDLEAERVERTLETYKKNLEENRGKRSKLERKIEDLETNLQIFHNRKEERNAIFCTFAMLTIKDGSRKTRIQKFQGKIFQAQKKFFEFIFANRKCPIINISLLNLGFSYTILRFPIDLKFKIKELQTVFGLEPKLPGINQILDASSFPLDLLEVDKLILAETEFSILSSAQKLIIRKLVETPAFETINNLKAHVIWSTLSPEDNLRLIGQWINNQRPIGSCYTFGYENRQQIRHTMERIINQNLDGARQEGETMIIPITNTSELRLSYEPTEEGEMRWMFKWEVLAAV